MSKISRIVKWVFPYGSRQEREFLSGIRGLIHVGAHVGQERRVYNWFGLDVIWIEPIPDVFEKLKSNISRYSKQRAFNYLVSDQDGQTVTFHISSLAGAASSILELGLLGSAVPNLRYTGELKMKTYRLDTILAENGIRAEKYDALLLDTQGSELMILQGATKLLRSVRKVQVEVADQETYIGCPRPHDILNFLSGFGFREIRRFHRGKYEFDILYTKE